MRTLLDIRCRGARIMAAVASRTLLSLVVGCGASRVDRAASSATTASTRAGAASTTMPADRIVVRDEFCTAFVTESSGSSAPASRGTGTVVIEAFPADVVPGKPIPLRWRKSGDAPIVLYLLQDSGPTIVFVVCEVPDLGSFVIRPEISKRFRAPGSGYLTIRSPAGGHDAVEPFRIVGGPE
jgi:hypothetical protein